MLPELLVLAASSLEAAPEEESSHLLFYVLGGGLALWGIAIAAVGIPRRGAFPASTRARNAIMLVTMLLVVATCGSAALSG